MRPRYQHIDRGHNKRVNTVPMIMPLSQHDTYAVSSARSQDLSQHKRAVAHHRGRSRHENRPAACRRGLDDSAQFVAPLSCSLLANSTIIPFLDTRPTSVISPTSLSDISSGQSQEKRKPSTPRKGEWYRPHQDDEWVAETFELAPVQGRSVLPTIRRSRGFTAFHPQLARFP